MAEEEKKLEDGKEGSNQMYLDEIKKLKETTIPKEEYERLLGENRNLLKTIVEGNPQPAGKEGESKKPVDVNKLRKDLFTGDHTNLDFAKGALELRKAIMDQGGTDPFLPVGKDIIVEDSDIASANRVAEALESCIEYADGNPDIFTTEHQRIMVDSAPIRRKTL